jgi:hypothetical protein
MSDLTLSDPLTEGERDETRPPGEGGDGDGVGGPRDGGPEPVVEPVVEPMRMSTEAQTERPTVRAGAGVPPWWLQPPPRELPHPMAARREPVGGPWYPPGPPQVMEEDHLVERVVSRLVDILGPRLAAQTPPSVREDLRQAPQGPREAPVASSTPEVEELLESVPEELA